MENGRKGKDCAAKSLASIGRSIDRARFLFFLLCPMRSVTLTANAGHPHIVETFYRSVVKIRSSVDNIYRYQLR